MTTADTQGYEEAEKHRRIAKGAGAHPVKPGGLQHVEDRLSFEQHDQRGGDDHHTRAQKVMTRENAEDE